MKYPELADLGKDELFVEWAFMLSNGDELRMPVRRIIKRNEQADFEREVRLKHNAQEIHIVTIEQGLDEI